MPYDPSLATAIETYSPSLVPLTQSRTWSDAALAADIAEEALRAAMMAAPRFWMVSMNSPLSQASSLTSSRIAVPATVPWLTSGYYVELWLPQMITFLTSPTGFPVRTAIWLAARLWSRRVIAVKFFFGMFGAKWESTLQLVFAGFATTSTLVVGF